MTMSFVKSLYGSVFLLGILAEDVGTKMRHMLD